MMEANCTCLEDEYRTWNNCLLHARKVWHIRPNIYIKKIDDGCYWYTYTVCDWQNAEHKYEGSAPSKEELWKAIGQEIQLHIAEEGSTYGL